MHSMLASTITLILPIKNEFPNRTVFVKLGKVDLDICEQFSLGYS